MRMTKPAQKRAYWGWLWWAPSVLVAVGVGAFHAWTSIQIRNNDYAMTDVRRRMESVTAELREVNVMTAEREDMEAVRVTGNELGLLPPRPDQIVRLAFNPAVYKAPDEQQVDAAATPQESTPTAKKRKPQPAIEMAKTEPTAAVSPRETGRLTMALDMDAALVDVNTAAPASAAAPSDEALDGSLDQMLDKF